MVLHLMRRAPLRFEYGAQLAGFVVDDCQPGDEVLARHRLPVFWGRGETGNIRARLIDAAAWPTWYSNASDVAVNDPSGTLSEGVTFDWTTFDPGG